MRVFQTVTLHHRHGLPFSMLTLIYFKNRQIQVALCFALIWSKMMFLGEFDPHKKSLRLILGSMYSCSQYVARDVFQLAHTCLFLHKVHIIPRRSKSRRRKNTHYGPSLKTSSLQLLIILNSCWNQHVFPPTLSI